MSNVIINKVMSIALAATLCTAACGGVAVSCIGDNSIDTAEAAVAKKTKPKNVYITKTGKKYHIKKCRTIKTSKKITKISLKKAKKAGYKPCKICF